MDTYQPSTPRAASGLIAVAMVAIAFGALVVAPAKQDSVSASLVRAASAKAGAPAPIEVAITPARIDVIAAREPNVEWALTDAARPNCKPAG